MQRESIATRQKTETDARASWTLGIDADELVDAALAEGVHALLDRVPESTPRISVLRRQTALFLRVHEEAVAQEACEQRIEVSGGNVELWQVSVKAPCNHTTPCLVADNARRL